MSVEIFTETSYEIPSEEKLKNKAFESEEPPVEFPCENKLGFTALCASCYWAKFLNDCPKNIREKNNQQDELNIQNPLAEDGALSSLELDFNILPSYETVSGEDSAASSSKVVVESVQPEQAAPEAFPQPETVSLLEPKSGSESGLETETKQEVEQPRSYRDLLFDDSIEVVIAAPKPYVKLVETQPVLQEELISEPVLTELVTIPLEPTVIETTSIETTPPEIASPKITADETVPTVELTIEPTVELVSSLVEDTVVEGDQVFDSILPVFKVLTVEIETEVEVETQTDMPHINTAKEVETDIIVFAPEQAAMPVQEKSDSNIQMIDFSLNEYVESVAVQLEADVPQSAPLAELKDELNIESTSLVEALILDSEVVSNGNEIEVADSMALENFLSFEEEATLPLTAAILRPESQENAANNPDDQDELLLKTPERLFPSLQKYGSIPFRYARSLIGVFALFALGIIDQ